MPRPEYTPPGNQGSHFHLAPPSQGIFLSSSSFTMDEHEGPAFELKRDKATLLWRINVKDDAMPLPTELDGQWTDLKTAKRAVTSYLAKTKGKQ